MNILKLLSFSLFIFLFPGTVIFSHGEPSRVIVFHVTPNPSSPEAFAVHLSGVHSNVSGGVRLR